MIQLNYKDPRPIYEQVKDGIRKLAYSGVLGPDEKLPSVRELAMKLAINPNTISRAYKDLEQEGFLYTVTGKGTFINQEYDLNDSRKQELWQQFEKAAKGLIDLSVSEEEMKERVNRLYVIQREQAGDSGVTSNEGESKSRTEKGGSIDDSGK